MKEKLITAAYKYDARQAKGKRYNPYALRIYLERIEEIIQDTKKGADIRSALCAGFTGSLLNAMLKAVSLEKPSDDEWTGKDKPWFYVPASDNQTIKSHE